MPTTLPSFAKINLGLRIGARRADGFHELRTVYQTIALHDTITVTASKAGAGKGAGIKVRCSDPRVPTDQANTCYRMAERVLRALKVRARVVIEIEKRLPLEGGLGAASSNAVVTMLALERELKRRLDPAQRLRLAAEVGSDPPLFLVGGTVLGCGRGEEVFPLVDLPGIPMVVVTPQFGVSTPAAFARWDRRMAAEKLTAEAASARMIELGRALAGWLGGGRSSQQSGVPARGRGRAEALLLDLVRTGIENDFERVVFSQYPELRDLKRILKRAGAGYAALSGSGSTVFGLFSRAAEARQAARRLRTRGMNAVATRTLTRAEYWQALG